MYYTIFTEKYQPKYTKPYKEEAKLVSPVVDDIDISFSSPEIYTNKEEIDDGIETTVSPIIKPSEGIKNKKMKKEEFKALLMPLYEKELESRGLNPAFAKSLVAQDALESGWGEHLSGKNNYGGIKGKSSSLRSTWEWNGKFMERVKSSFRDFNSLKDYVKYKVGLLNSNRYRALTGRTEDFAEKVKAGGYATDPNYVKKINSIVANLRNGGILKCENGSNTKWLMRYYNQRKPQLAANADSILPDVYVGAVKSKDINNKLHFRDWDLDGASIEDNLKYLNLKDQYKVLENYKKQFGDQLYIDPNNEQDSIQIYNNFMQFRRWMEDNFGITPDHQWTPKELEELRNNKDIPSGVIDVFKPEILSDMLNKVASNKESIDTI